MFTDADVKALLRDKRLRPPVASLYLNADRGTLEGEKYLASFRHLIQQADRALSGRADPRTAIARGRLTDALPELLTFLSDEVAPAAAIRGVAFFVSLAPVPDTTPHAPAFTAFTLPRSVRNQTAVDRRPAIRPLLFLLDQYERTGVIVADRNHARIFTLFLGELETIHRRSADTPRRHHQGGWKQMLLQRDVDGHSKAHIRATVREASAVFRENPVRRLVLGGTDETIALLKAELSPTLAALLSGTFPAESHASDGGIVARALALAQAAERAAEETRVKELTETLAASTAPAWSGGAPRAVHGPEATLRALTERRVRRLLLRRGFRLQGAVCDNCGVLSLPTSGLCPSCRTPLRAVTDVFEHAVERAQDEGAEVEFVEESPALEALGGIGAILRF